MCAANTQMVSKVAELMELRKMIEDHLGIRSTHFSFPPFLVELLDAPPNN